MNAALAMLKNAPASHMLQQSTPAGGLGYHPEEEAATSPQRQDASSQNGQQTYAKL